MQCSRKKHFVSIKAISLTEGLRVIQDYMFYNGAMPLPLSPTPTGKGFYPIYVRTAYFCTFSFSVSLAFSSFISILTLLLPFTPVSYYSLKSIPYMPPLSVLVSVLDCIVQITILSCDSPSVYLVRAVLAISFNATWIIPSVCSEQL